MAPSGCVDLDRRVAAKGARGGNSNGSAGPSVCAELQCLASAWITFATTRSKRCPQSERAICRSGREGSCTLDACVEARGPTTRFCESDEQSASCTGENHSHCLGLARRAGRVHRGRSHAVRKTGWALCESSAVAHRAGLSGGKDPDSAEPRCGGCGDADAANAQTRTCLALCLRPDSRRCLSLLSEDAQQIRLIDWIGDL